MTVYRHQPGDARAIRHMRTVILPLPEATHVWLASGAELTGPHVALFIAFRFDGLSLQSQGIEREVNEGRSKRAKRTVYDEYPHFPSWADGLREHNMAEDLDVFAQTAVMVKEDWSARWYDLAEDAFWTRDAAAAAVQQRLEQRAAAAAAKDPAPPKAPTTPTSAT